MANNKEYNLKKKALTEHYSNRILAVFTLGVFNFILLFYLNRVANGQMGVTLLMHHYAVYYTLAGCSLAIAAVLFVLWKKESGARAFYKENYFYFWIYFVIAAVAFALIKPVGNALGSVNAWVRLYIGADVLYVVASAIYFSIVSHIKVKKLQK
ncbi:MAG: hypothetical protein II351_01890 [Clostridia bacterium]|nr:hypothetical protein [Clostridia bacterium]